MDPMQPWLAGFLGGLLASVAFTFITLPALKGNSLPLLVVARAYRSESPGIWLLVGSSVLHYLYGGVAGLVFAIVAVDVFEWTTFLWVWGIALGALLLLLAAITWIPLSGGFSRVRALTRRQRNAYAANAISAHLIFGYIVGLVTEDFGF